MSNFIEVAKMLDEAANTMVEVSKDVFIWHEIRRILHRGNTLCYVNIQSKGLKD